MEQQSSIKKNSVRLFLILFAYVFCMGVLLIGLLDISKAVNSLVPDLFMWNIKNIDLSIINIPLNWIGTTVSSTTIWFAKIPIIVGNLIQNQIGFSTQNFLLDFVKNNSLTFQWIIVGVSLVLTFYFYKGYLYISKQVNNKSIAVTGVIFGSLNFLILIVYFSSVLSGGAWENQAFFYWNWPLGITAFSWVLLISIISDSQINSSVNVNFVKIGAIASQILILTFFIEAIFFLGVKTSTEVEIKSDRGWQFVNATVEKGQKVEISCDDSLWTVDKYDLQNYPLSSFEGISSNILPSDLLLPLPDANLGSLLAKVGMDTKYFAIGKDTTFTSSANGYLYLRINDWDDNLWNNSGTVQCQVMVPHSQILQPLTLENIINTFNQLFMSKYNLNKLELPIQTPSKVVQNTPSPTETETPTPLSTNTSEPSTTPRPTITLTPTIAVPLILGDNLNDPVIIQASKFTGSNYAWSYSPSQITFSNGVATLPGITSWSNYLNFNNPLQEGEGFIIDYSYTPSSNCEIYIANGNWYTDNYKRFGVYPLFSTVISAQSPGTNYWNGKISTLNPLGIRTKSNNWYTLFIGIDSNGRFLAIIWEKDNPSNFIKYAQNPGAKWSGLNWNLGITADQGAISLSNFMKIGFSHFK